MKKSLSINNIKAYQPVVVEFDGAWKEAIGDPELKGSWIIWGNSGNGKTSFALQLAMYFTKFCKVVYDSIEEGMSKSMQDAINRISIDTHSKYRFSLLDGADIPTLKETLRKKRSAKVVFIDSLQYTGLSYADYKQLRDEFPNKLFIFVSHADGREPKGEVAKSVRYDAMVKIRVEHYWAFTQGRYGGGEPFVIWKQEADKYPIKDKKKENGE